MNVFFENTFKNIHMPVVVCVNEKDYPIVFANSSMRLLMNPLLTTDNLKEKATISYLSEILHFQSREQFENFFELLNAAGSINNFKADILNYEDEPLPISISANVIDLENRQYIALYVGSTVKKIFSSVDVNDVLAAILRMAFHSGSVDEAINNILRFIGHQANVSRVYIFEEISAAYTRNTYEWCAEGIQPAIQDLQNLKKEDYNYDVIVNGGMYITNDIRDLPENDRVILEAQGIKSLAILPLIYDDRPLGYIGFDECNNYHTWNSLEVYLLKSVADIIVSLIVRRNTERQVNRSFKILQTISDNIDDIVYVTDMDTYEVVFVNKMLANELNKRAEDIVGQKCWAVLQAGRDEPCEFCPIPKMLERGEKKRRDMYVWEHQNTVNGKWYLVKDAIIEWIDGTDVHIETATEITHQKNYEEQLMRFASIDSMTGTYNREWGYKIMNELRSGSLTDSSEVSLVFIDLDGLKFTNDNFGHDVGDEMIIQTVEAIRSCTRKTDAMCRWGGDEFILLLECAVPIAHNIMKNVEAKIAQYNERLGKPYKISISYGITELSRDHDVSLDSIITHADMLMYENKMSKRCNR